jgi:hypothetical protein
MPVNRLVPFAENADLDALLSCGAPVNRSVTIE